MVLGATWLGTRQVAGYVSGALWLSLVMAPLLGQRLVVRASLRLDHRRAAAIARAVRWLHPFDGYWEQGDLLLGRALAQEGRTEEAVEVFERLAGSRSPVSRLGTLDRLRILGRFDELTRWVESEGLTGDPMLVVHYSRALGELGRVEDLVRIHAARARTIELSGSPFAAVYLLAFTGRREALDHLLSVRAGGLSEAARAIWCATCDQAAGRAAEARPVLEELAEHQDAGIRTMARRRLDAPARPAKEVLSDEAIRILDGIEKDIRQQQVFRPVQRGLLRRARTTYGLIALNVLFFAAEMVYGGTTDPRTLVELGAIVSDRVMAGEVWRLVTANFLHFGFLHLALNMAGLLLFAPFLERAIGAARFLFVFLASGVGSVTAVTLVAALLGRNALLVGASGGVMGLVGATGFILLRAYRRHRTKPAKRELYRVGLIVLLQAGFDLVTPQVSFLAHSGGVVIGFAACALVATVAPSTTS